MIHQPVSVVSQCLLNAWLSGWFVRDQRRLTGSGSTLEALRDDVLYESTYFTLLITLHFLGPTVCKLGSYRQ